jgi:ABC-2 type transport system permease protein
MFYLRLIQNYAVSSTKNEMAYRANFWISILHSVLNLGTGILGVFILFGQVDTIRGWDLPSTLAILGVYLTLGSLRRLFIGPSLESLAGMDGEVWSGKLDFTLLRPIDIQFQASFRYWQPLAIIDLALGISVLVVAIFHIERGLSWLQFLSFTTALFFGVTMLYATLLAFAGLVFLSPGFLFTWIFDSFFQMARYPVGLYPGWLQLILTWIIPVGIMTTIPAQALIGILNLRNWVLGLVVSTLYLIGASLLFRSGIRRYASASS